MHPDIYRDLVRQRHADLGREAARTSLAAAVRAGRASAPIGPSVGLSARQLRLATLRVLQRGLRAAESRVALALARALNERA